MTPKWSTACPDWEDRIVSRRPLIPFGPLFPDQAREAADIFLDLKIVDAPGSPPIGEICRPWVFQFADAVFGAYNHETGRRLIREFLLCVAKKNSKSTLAAAIMLTALLRNWRISGEFLIVAPTIEVAQNSFKPAYDMIRHSPELAALLHPQEHYRTITHKTTGATLKVIAADNETVSGKKAVGVLVDELWLFGKRPNAENMLREATGGLASRPEGFVIYLSTQSDEPPAGIFKQKLDYFRDVRDGKIQDNKSLPVLYEFPEAMIKAEKYRDRDFYYITNPNLGASVDAEFVEDEFAKADRAGPQSLAGFYAKHLNLEIGTNLRGNRWPGAEYWDRRADPSLTFDAILARSEVIVVGIDGGGLDDLFGLAVLGRDRVESEFTFLDDDGETKTYREKRWHLWSHAWCHSGVLERRKSIAARLQDFAKAKELTIVDDSLGDISEIVAVVERVKDAGLLGGVAVDPAGLGEFQNAMIGIDVTQENKLLIGVGQGYRQMNAIKTAERRLARDMLRHGGSSLMAWCVGNVKIEPTATAIRATKQNAGDAKIDPWAALMDAVDIMSTNPEAAGGSLYSDGRELRFA